MTNVSQVLNALSMGDPLAAEQLLPLVYDELRRLAGTKLANEKPGQTLQATALVHEAYLRLVDGDASKGWENRRHFFGAAAEAMRRILVESARRKNSLKRAGGVRSEMDVNDVTAAFETPVAELLSIHDALDELAVTNPHAAELVKLRYFSGLTFEECAEVLNVSLRTAKNRWSYARAWLIRKIGSGDER